MLVCNGVGLVSNVLPFVMALKEVLLKIALNFLLLFFILWSYLDCKVERTQSNCNCIIEDYILLGWRTNAFRHDIF